MRTALLFLIVLFSRESGGFAAEAIHGGSPEMEINRPKMIKTTFNKYVSMIEDGKIRRGMRLSELKKLTGNELIIGKSHSAFVRLSRWDLPAYVQSAPVWELEFTFDKDDNLSSYFIHIPIGK